MTCWDAPRKCGGISWNLLRRTALTKPRARLWLRSPDHRGGKWERSPLAVMGGAFSVERATGQFRCFEALGPICFRREETPSVRTDLVPASGVSFILL